MLRSSDVPISQSALLVIDVQQAFILGSSWSQRNNHHFEKNVSRLIDLYRAAQLPIFFIQHTDSDPGWSTTDPGFKLMDFIKPRPSEPVLTKNTRNAFTSTTLQADLIHLGVRRLIITGIQMEQCCETTTRVAADLGYAVDFVTEATLTFPITDPEDPAHKLGVDAIRERTEFVLRKRFARIATVDDIAHDLRTMQLSVTA